MPSQKALYGGEYVPTYNQNTLDELGNFHPDFTGGFNTSISFKNFRLSANIDFSVGGQIVSYTKYSGVAVAVFLIKQLNLMTVASMFVNR